MENTEDLYQNSINIAGGEERFVCPQSLILNTYIGCSHGCLYCYAYYIQDMYKHWDRVKPADYKKIKDTIFRAYIYHTDDLISRMIRMKIPFRFANLTDGFQSIERKYKISYKTLQLLKEYDHPVIINTKGLVLLDPEYLEILKGMKVIIQFTITTDDDHIGKKLELNAPLVSERIKAIKILSDLGIIVQVRYSPVFPLLTDNPESLFQKVAKNGAKDIICEFVRLPFTRKYLKALNDSLGFDYISYLMQNEYPLIKTSHWYKVQKPYIFDEYMRFKKIAKKNNLNFYICCEERPELNEWANCCGSDKYKGFESCMNWTIQMNGKRIGDQAIGVEDYIKGLNIPYANEFTSYFQGGNYKESLYGIEFNEKDKTYKRGKI